MLNLAQLLSRDTPPQPTSTKRRLGPNSYDAERGRTIYDLRQSSLSYREIGLRLNLSFQRVHSLYKDFLFRLSQGKIPPHLIPRP